MPWNGRAKQGRFSLRQSSKRNIHSVTHSMQKGKSVSLKEYYWLVLLNKISKSMIRLMVIIGINQTLMERYAVCFVGIIYNVHYLDYWYSSNSINSFRTKSTQP